MHELRISYALNVLNGEPFIWYQLNSIYGHAHEIIIVEGAYKKFAHAAKDYRSTDNTVNIIKTYPDPQKKIKFIMRDYYYDDRVGMCSEFMVDLTGDVLWQVDVDEFYCNETHRYVKDLFESDEELDQIAFNFVDYYAGFDWVIEGYDEALLDVIRVNRIYPGMLWSSQRPPTLELNGKKLIPRKKIYGKEMLFAGHLMHNATMLFDAQVRDKFKYYANMWPKSVTGSKDWLEASWEKFEIKFCVSGMLNTLTYLVPRTAALPEGLEEMEVDISRGKCINFGFFSQTIYSKVAQDQEYGKKILAAKAINKIKGSSPTAFISVAIRAYIFLCPLSPSRDKLFMSHIFLKSIRMWPYYALRNLLKTILSSILLRR